MKKILCISVSLFLLFTLCACSGSFDEGNMDNAVINFEDCDYYSEDELNDALSVVENEFRTWRGFIMHSVEVKYAGPDASYCNMLSDFIEYDEALTFTTSFTTGSDGYSGFEENMTYHDFDWCLARVKGGRWHLVEWGIC